MDWSGLLKLLHVALAMALVTGVIGRWLLLGSAERSETIFLPRGRRFAGVLDGARSAGRVTPELHAAFADPTVPRRPRRRADRTGLIVALMVLKPF